MGLIARCKVIQCFNVVDFQTSGCQSKVQLSTKGLMFHLFHYLSHVVIIHICEIEKYPGFPYSACLQVVCFQYLLCLSFVS